ncbi:MAG: hypothetical protein GY856_11785, partial [bacterium]|nr:hypothetical protein [bacterium]
EFAGTFLAGPPTLGVWEEQGRSRVVPAIPGMIMTLNPEPAAVESADRSRLMAQGSFHRLFAPTAAHTTVKAGRSCAACHSDPLALGIGRGELVFRPTDAVPRWTFESTYGALRDGLPADAWTPLDGLRDGPVATRTQVRPFTAEEQERILRVGACLICHEPSAPASEGIYRDFARALDNLRAPCRVPAPSPQGGKGARAGANDADGGGAALPPRDGPRPGRDRADLERVPARRDRENQ